MMQSVRDCFQKKNIFAWIMKNCLEEYQACTFSEIMENYIEGDPQVWEISVGRDKQTMRFPVH